MVRKFQFNWKVSAFTLACLVAFLRLGLWQLDREDEKRVLIADRELRKTETPVLAEMLPAEGDVGGTPVRLSGAYDEQVTLLQDNVVLQGQVGFEVYQLFEDAAGIEFVVNRGFVAMGRTRQDAVDIPPVNRNQQELTGVVYQGTGAPLALAESTALSGSFPEIVQRVSIPLLESVLDRDIYPFVIRLAENQPGALPRYWPDTVISPKKHFGYALQWFTMAFAVVLAWAFFSFRKEEVE